MVINTQYSIPKECSKELAYLIMDTESLDIFEKQYWFDIIPSMTTEQIERLNEILSEEKQKLKEIEDKYSSELQRADTKYAIANEMLNTLSISPNNE